jgi:hypothetical protein
MASATSSAGDLGTPGQFHDLGSDAFLFQVSGQGHRMGRRDAGALEIGWRPDRGIGWNRQRERTESESQRNQSVDLRPLFMNDVEAHDSQIGHAVGHVLGDVVISQEEKLDVEIPAPGEQASLVIFELETDVLEQFQAVAGQPTVALDRDSEALAIPAGHLSLL